MRSGVLTTAKPSIWLTTLQTGYFVSLAAAVIFMGAVHGPVIAAVCLLFASLAAVSLLRPLRRELHQPMLLALLLAGTLVGWILLQQSSLLGTHPSWLDASDALGPLQGALSPSPAAGFAGLANLLVPALAFATGLVLFQDDRSAELLFKVAAVLALGGAILGLYEYAAAPEQLLFQARLHKMDGVSAYFVNRNTAATFLGIGAVAWCAVLLDNLQKTGLGGLKRILLETDRDHRRRAVYLVGLILCVLTMIVALFLTKSRAGISASLAGMLAVFLLTFRPSRTAPAKASWLAPLAASGIFILSIVAIYGSQFLTRATDLDASADPRWCFAKDMVTAIRERPLTGSGYGALEYVYPAYRNPACMSLELVLDRGHNGYLELAMGAGIPSLLVLLAGAAYLARTLGWGAANRRRMRYLPIASLGTLVLVIIHTAFDFSLQILGVATYTAALLAAGVVASRPEPSLRRHRSKPRHVGSLTASPIT